MGVKPPNKFKFLKSCIEINLIKEWSNCINPNQLKMTKFLNILKFPININQNNFEERLCNFKPRKGG